MSLILDALNKADREREYRDAVPDLNTVHGVARPPRPGHSMWMIGGLVAAVLMVLGLLAVLWLRSSTTLPADVALQEPVAFTPGAEPVRENPTLTGDSVRTALGVVGAPTDEEVRALYQPRQDTRVMEVVEPQIQSALAEPTIITPAQPRASSVDEELARALWEESRQGMQQPVPAELLRQAAPGVPAATKPAAEPQPLPADLPAEETLAGHSDIPFLHQLPVSVQDTIPTLMYARHDYEQGFVVINKEQLQMGSAAKGGVLLERILADGVLLSLDGTEFKLSSLSSWVNY